MKDQTNQELSVMRQESQLPAVPTPAEMLQAVIKTGITAENAAVMEKLIDLHERVEKRNAEKEFNQAFVALQQEMPRIKATKPVPNNDGGVRYRFAPYEEIMEQVQPLLVRHGFTISFSTRFDGPRVFKICTLRHTAGHSASNEFGVRIGQGPPKSSEAQGDGAAGTYAKRFALCDALNIVVAGLDNDASLEGAFITPAQAKSLRDRVLATGADEVKFLAFAQVRIADNATVEDIKRGYQQIPAAVMPILDASLKKKEDTRK